MKIACFLLLIVSQARSQEVSTPSSLLRPRNSNHHPFDAEQFLKSLKVEPTRQGPVLFPNDAPPPPRPPLIVTSRPLLESIARSELGSNNTVTSQSQINGQRVSFVPYLARVQDYRPYNPRPIFKYNFVPTQIPYADVVKKSRLNTLEGANRYDDYEDFCYGDLATEDDVQRSVETDLETFIVLQVLSYAAGSLGDLKEQTALPPIYKALSDHAQQKALKLTQKHNNYKAPLPDYSQNYQNNIINEENSDYDQNQNYAFSYRVKDQKTGDDFSHSQHSSGSATNGEYRVRLPDGRMQIVSYTADENGYKADVRYDEDVKSNVNSIDHKQNGYNDYTQQNDYVDRTSNNNVYEGRNNAYVDKSNNVYAGRNNNAYVSNNNVYTVKNDVDYADRSLNNDFNVKKQPVSERDEYYYPDVSKEYSDYSLEHNSNYEPHKSKFTFANNENFNNKDTATVKPSYEELKDLFTQNYDQIELKVPSTTPTTYDGTTERVVVIGSKSPNLYTNIRNNIPNIASYATPRGVVATTPRSYLVSTIASLKNRVHSGDKPILSDRFIDKINKYLSFN